MSQKLHVIGEAGTNHGGRCEIAEQLVAAAVEAGADSVKFQIIFPEGLYLPRFWRDSGYMENEVFQLRAAGMLPDGDYVRLADYCRDLGILLSASIFDLRGLDLLCRLDPPYIKIASCDLNNLPLLRQVAERGRKIILSTGMASLGEIERAVEAVTSAGHQDLVLMHCVSMYPAPLERMNLGFLRVLQTAFGFPVGLSDHTESSLAGAIAVSMGVEWVEKHCTLDRRAKGFDHAYAMEPAMLKQYVQDLRAAAVACQRPEVKIGDGERQVRQRARRAIYAARALHPRETVTEADLLVVRPEGPLTPGDVERVLGRTVRHLIHQYQPISLEYLD